MREQLGRPAVVLTQGGLAPVALELWRRGGATAVAGVSFVSPPPFQFWGAGEAAEEGRKQPSRRRQRLFWLLAQSTVGGVFFRYLRSENGERIRAFPRRISSVATSTTRGLRIASRVRSRLAAGTPPSHTSAALCLAACGGMIAAISWHRLTCPARSYAAMQYPTPTPASQPRSRCSRGPRAAPSSLVHGASCRGRHRRPRPTSSSGLSRRISGSRCQEHRRMDARK